MEHLLDALKGVYEVGKCRSGSVCEGGMLKWRLWWEVDRSVVKVYPVPPFSPQDAYLRAGGGSQLTSFTFGSIGKPGVVGANSG